MSWTKSMSLRIFLLGQFKLQANELAIELPSRPAQSLLAYLALNAGLAHRREKLANLFWPEANEANARGYLRQALWRIRKCLESGSLDWEKYLQISEIEVVFDDRSDYWLDVDLLLGAVEQRTVEEITEIVRLYRGELLPGFYDEWVVVERERVQSAYHQKMNILLERLIHAGNWQDALAWAEQWIRLGYAPEPAFRILMHAHAGLGNPGMVNATYQRCVASLNRELNVEPAPETQRLYEQILDGGLKIPAPPAPAPDLVAKQPSFLDEIQIEVERPVFVAREGELAQLGRFLDRVLAGQGQVVFVTGEVGSGKTALIQEFSWRAQEAHSDLIVVSGNCNAYSGIGDPYLPFREILGLLSGDVEARWAAGAMTRGHARRLWNTLPLTAQALVEAGPDLIDTFLPRAALLERIMQSSADQADWLARLNELVERKLSGSGTPSSPQSDLFEQYTRVLQSLSRRVVLMVWVEDLQWADRGSISLLFHLGRRVAGSRILIIGSYRPEEIAIGRDGERHPLDQAVNELQRDLGHITVNLGQAESREFIDAILDSEPNRLGNAFREMLFRQTCGQPLFTVELLRGLQERGDLVQDREGYWLEGPTLDWETLPARVEAVIAERIGRLPQTLQATLQVASVEGELFTAEVTARARATSSQEMLGRLSGELDRKHRLISAQSILRMGDEFLSRYRFRHILFQKYLYSSLDEVERAHLHEQVGNALEGLHAIPEQAAVIAPQLALHFQKAHITEKAVNYLHLAGERALNLSAYQEAVAHLTSGLNLLLTLPDSPARAQQELSLQVSLGLCYKVATSDPQGIEHLQRARELCQQMGKITQLCQVVGELSIHYFVMAEYQAARELAEEALSLAEQSGDELLLAVSHWHLGFVLFSLGDFTKARAHFQQVTCSYVPQRHHLPLLALRGVDVGVSSMAYDSACLWCLGYPDQSSKRSQDAMVLARELGHAFSLADVLCYGGCVPDQMRRDVTALREHSEALIRSVEKIGVLSFKGTGTCYLGAALTWQGRTEEGIAHIRQGLEIRKMKDVRCTSLGILGALAEAEEKAGNSEEGMTTLTEAIAMAEETGEHYYEAEIFRMQGDFLLRRGDESSAEASLRKAIDVASRQSAKSWELRAAIDLARLWQKQGKRDDAHGMLSEIYGWFSEGFDTPDLREARALIEELA